MYAPKTTSRLGSAEQIGFPGVPVGIERGYFKQQGIDVEMVFFDSAQPSAVAVASGDIDFGTVGVSATFLALAAQGQLKLIASSGGNAPGYFNLAFIVSNKAWDAGLRSVADLKGHSIAISQVGTASTTPSRRRRWRLQPIEDVAEAAAIDQQLPSPLSPARSIRQWCRA